MHIWNLYNISLQLCVATFVLGTVAAVVLCVLYLYLIFVQDFYLSWIFVRFFFISLAMEMP